MYKKIRTYYSDNYLKEENPIEDPYGEEEWDENLDKSDNIRYKKKYTSVEDMPIVGLRKRKDIR